MADWHDEGLHYVSRFNKHYRLSTIKGVDGLWIAAVAGQFSTYGVTRGNAIRNACAPVNHRTAQAALDEYAAWREGKISRETHIAFCVARHTEDLKRCWEDAKAHGET